MFKKRFIVSIAVLLLLSGQLVLPSSFALSCGNEVVFSVHKNGAEQPEITPYSHQIVIWPYVELDTNTNFANNRFTPTLAGYYFLHASIYFASYAAAGYPDIIIYRNGTMYKAETQYITSPLLNSVSVSAIVIANGTTDYFEVYVQQATGVNAIISGSVPDTYFQGFKIK